MLPNIDDNYAVIKVNLVYDCLANDIILHILIISLTCNGIGLSYKFGLKILNNSYRIKFIRY